MDVWATRRGRYRCGCSVDVVRSSHGVIRLVPVCARHGERFALTTIVARRLAMLGRHLLAAGVRTLRVVAAVFFRSVRFSA
jgi:hypothetical protein